jgi:NAD(P)H-hydrate epimerase
MPSGLPGEDSATINPETIIRADYTLAIEFPRLSFMFAENNRYTGKWILVQIGLHPGAIAGTESPYQYIVAETIASLLRRREKFDHKGKFGHALLAAGSFGKMGAAILAGRAVLRAGAGLLTCHIPSKGYNIMQCTLPEAMVETDQSDILVSEIREPKRFDAIGMGPGMGTKPNAQGAVHKLLSNYKGPLVLDADAINILGLNPDWLNLLTPLTVLTPHPGEFARLAGNTADSYQRLLSQIEFSGKYKCVIVLKGAHTSISLPDGRVFFNSTGNPGMATAGSGDVLTGIILGLLAQGYTPERAALTGVYLHGLSGDIAASERCQESLIASDIIENLYEAYTKTSEQLL